MFKLLMSWNIRPGREDEYFEFVVQEFGPTLMKLGVRPTDAWYTQYGDSPQILQGGIVEELEPLLTQLVRNQIPVNSYVIGPRTDSTFMAGLAAQTGGAMAVDQVKVPADVVGRYLASFATEVVYWPRSVELPETFDEVYPRQLPPLRGDRETVLIGVGQNTKPFDVKVTALVSWLWMSRISN